MRQVPPPQVGVRSSRCVIPACLLHSVAFFVPSLTSKVEPSSAPLSYSHSELLPTIARIVPKAALPTLAPTRESPKGALYDGKTHSTFLQRSGQPRTLRIQHEGGDEYEKGSRHNREKQPNGASKHKYAPKGNDGAALGWLLRLCDSVLLPNGPPVLRLITSPHVSFVSTFSNELRREGDGGLSQRDGILTLKFSYVVYEQREAAGRSKFNFAHRVSQSRDPTKRAIWRCKMEGVCICALTTGAGVLGLGNTGATAAPGVQEALRPIVGGGIAPPAQDASNTSRVAALQRNTLLRRNPP